MKDINFFEPPPDAPVPRFPRSVGLRILFDLSIGAAFGASLAALLFALFWWRSSSRQYWLGVNTEFTIVMCVATVLGLVGWLAVGRMWREAHARVTPWLVAAAASWIALRLAISLAPPTQRWDDPAPELGAYAFFVQIAMIFVAILAFMDWRALREERAGVKLKQPDEVR